MSRRSRLRRQGGAYYSPSAAPALPLSHEGVRRSFELEYGDAYRASLQSILGALSPVLTPTRRPRLVAPPPAKQKLQRDRGRAYAGLRLLQIRVPAKVDFCVKRKVRREVIFARGVGGRSGAARGRFGRYRRTPNSLYKC